MAVKTVSIGNLEDVYQYDDTEVYSDSSPVRGVKVETLQIIAAPVVGDDGVRLSDLPTLSLPTLILSASTSLTIPSDRQMVVPYDYQIDGVLTIDGRLGIVH